ncbi:DUF92 domain-containing protein [Senegalia massiliensis]|uniref:DUF92 domain-containing protein n=1 Tax=Senegalia massiliensis TaxID=1720316 RepID=A0A845R354_9CLOT|nr:DUF92 domain-containing protein [Senegalia massiliensis]NBI06973.1 DUF92 domain-containing protein [Senegalia massiliensis]
MNDFFGMIISFVFVCIILIVAEILNRYTNTSEEFNRKFVHIGVSNWWIISMMVIDNKLYASIPPFIFIILNYISYKKSIFKSMKRNQKESLGIVYFPISLLILVFIFWDVNIYIGAIGILIMGYGDGLAALFGIKFGLNTFYIGSNKKSFIGTFTMFMASFIISIIFLSIAESFGTSTILISFIIAIIATILELITPFGLDNITVPIFSSILAYFLININNDFYFYINRILIGFIFSGLIGFLAYKKRSLTVSGLIGAIILGTTIFVTTGFFGASIMILFFISSSFLSHFKKKDKTLVASQFDKTGDRDIFQVFANGGIGLIYSILYFFTKEIIFIYMFIVAFAAANADTWSTELGILDKNNPISLRNLKRVSKGTSGAVSILGTISGFLGAFLIATYGYIYIYLFSDIKHNILVLFILTVSGFLGTIIDSLLGASVQAIYLDENGNETEKKFINQSIRKLSRGFKIINNDFVNITSILLATLFVLVLL